MPRKRKGMRRNGAGGNLPDGGSIGMDVRRQTKGPGGPRRFVVLQDLNNRRDERQRDGFF